MKFCSRLDNGTTDTVQRYIQRCIYNEPTPITLYLIGSHTLRVMTERQSSISRI